MKWWKDLRGVNVKGNCRESNGNFRDFCKKSDPRSKYTMMDRDGLKSTISLGHGQGRGMGGSLVLGESDKPHGRISAGVGAEDSEGGGTRIRAVADVQGRQGDDGGGFSYGPPRDHAREVLGHRLSRFYLRERAASTIRWKAI